MYQEFKINKQSGTYSETLEAFGVANLVNEIWQRSESKGVKVTIEDNELYYSVKANKEITEDMLNKLSYFQIIKFIKKEDKQQIPVNILDYYDYPLQKGIVDDFKERFKVIDKNKELNKEQKKAAKKSLNNERLSEFGQKIDPEFDVYREIKGNPYASFLKLFENFHNHQSEFSVLVKEILNYYVEKKSDERAFKLSDEKPTAQQLYNPNQGKGLNKAKANNASMGNLDSGWISETMKISGALSIMVCQYVKVGSGYDLKIYVPEFNDILLHQAKSIMLDFKRNLKSTSPIKLDVINIMDLAIKFIQRTPDYNKGKIKNTIKGFLSVYQKDLGQNKAVVNIAFINTPDFIKYHEKEQGHEWIEILEQQRSIISGIEELGDAVQGLQAYRAFLGSLNHSALNNFNKFSYWYCSYLTQALSREKYYVKPFNLETLNKFYTNMEPKLSEIIVNEGFKAVATAIRKSTVSLQYTPKDQRKFEIRYGLAQQLQNKSKSKEDLATFIGEFVGTYNAETARYAEKNNGKAFRANVKDDELLKFYEILDKEPARLVGALLSSYGFALTSKEKVEIPDTESSDDDENLENE